MDKKPILTPKGIATLSAIEAGLLPKVDGGWDNSLFNRFWSLYEKRMIVYGYFTIHESALASIQKDSQKKL